MRSKLVILFLLSFYFFKSQTTVGGVITSNTIWNLAGSPYLVTSNILVFPNITLNVQAGVVVKFNSNTELSVRGKLAINGSKTDSVTFTSSAITPSKSDWKGVKIENNLGGKITVNYLKGLYADELFNIAYNSIDTVLKMKNSRCSYNNIVLFSYDPSTFRIIVDSSLFTNNSFCSIYSNYLTILNSKFYNNDKVVHGWSGPTVDIENSYIYGSTIYAFNMSGKIINSVIKNNAVGVKLRDDIILMYDSIIGNSKGLEITTVTNITNNNVIHNYFNYNSSSAYHTTNSSINLAYNCWGTTDSSVIETMIYDVYDNVSLGLVTFMPLDCYSAVGIQKNELSKTFNVYPNPFTKEVNISLGEFENEKVTISIFNSLGALVKLVEIRSESGNNVCKVDFEELTKGLYLMNLKTERQSLYKKIIRD